METAEVKKVYLVDSENVGDIWVTHIMEFARPEDEIAVFYTPKSPYMCYENIRKLMETDREIIFIKCVEGQNALDFQLVTELGYRIGNEEETTEYVVVTNDTGFDAAVRYWKAKGKLVKRYNTRFCQLLLNQYKNQTENEEKDNLEKTTEQKPEEKINTEKQTEKIVEKDIPEKSIKKETQENSSLGKSTEEKDILQKTIEKTSEKEILEDSKMAEELQIVPKEKEIVEEDILKLDAEKNMEENIIIEEKEGLVAEEEKEKTEELICSLLSCIGVNNISDFHNALVIFLGENKAKEVYKDIKSNISEYSIKKNMKLKEKFKVYCQLVFEQDTVETGCPKNFSNFVYDAKEKRGNLNTFRATLLDKFGKDKGMEYYNIIKPHVKILNRIQKIK